MKKIYAIALVAMAITVSATAQDKVAAEKKEAKAAKVEKKEVAKKEHAGETKVEKKEAKPAAEKKAPATK